MRRLCVCLMAGTAIVAGAWFARPPATAQLMYDPKTTAQTALDVLEVKAK